MILTACAAMILASCGGGGSSSGGGAINLEPSASTKAINSFIGNRDNQLTLSSVEMSMAVEHVNEQFAAAAITTPQSGSTTQSSESADRVGIANADSVELNNGQILLAIENAGVGSSWSETSTVIISSPNNDGYHVINLTQTVSGAGNLYLNAYTDIDSDSNGDYLVGGTWALVNEARNGIEIGAFADGSEPVSNFPVSDIDITATYRGNAQGIRLTANTVSDFSADVVLNADFGDETIEGIVTNRDLDLTLGIRDGDTTNINNNRRFDGETSMAGGYEGEWGGEFYGDGATSAAGTFGATKGTAGNADSDSFIGFFGARFADSGSLCNAGGGENTGTYTSPGVCQALTGACNAGGGVNTGERNGVGACIALTGSCNAGGGVDTGERNNIGTCEALTGACNAGGGANTGDRNGIGACIALTGSCDSGGGANTGERNNIGACIALTGSCDSGGGANTGERNGVGTCIALTGSCDSGGGANTGERNGVGACIALTGSCDSGGGANTGERNGVGECIAHPDGTLCNAGGGAETGTISSGTCVARTGACDISGGTSNGMYDGSGVCIINTGACDISGGTNNGTYNNAGVCIETPPDDGDACDAGGGAGTGTIALGICEARSGACNAGGGAGSGTYNSVGTCEPRSGPCNAGGGAGSGTYNGVGTCEPRSGPCDSGTGANSGTYNNVGACRVLPPQVGDICDTGLGIGTGTRNSDLFCDITPPTNAPDFTTMTSSASANGDHIIELTQVLETGGTLKINHYITGNDMLTIRMEDVSPIARNITVGESFRTLGTFVTINGRNSRMHCLLGDLCLWEHAGIVTVAISPSCEESVCDYIRVSNNVFIDFAFDRWVYIPEGSTASITNEDGLVIDFSAPLTVGSTTENYPVHELAINGVIGKYRINQRNTLYVGRDGGISTSNIIGPRGARQTIAIHRGGCDGRTLRHGVCEGEFNNDDPYYEYINDDWRVIWDKVKVLREDTNSFEDHYFEPYSGQTVVVVEGDTDYLSGGTWVYQRPENGSMELGSFVNGPTLANTTIPRGGVATYNGNAYGIHLTNGIANNFSGDVLLEANFNLPISQVTGMITSNDLSNPIILEGSRHNIDRNDFGDDEFSNIRYNGNNLGSFGGDTAMEGGYTGNWDAQFYGELATSAAGTFNVIKGDDSAQIITDDVLTSGDFTRDRSGFIRSFEIQDTFEGEAFIGYFNAKADTDTSTVSPIPLPSE